MNTFIKTLLWCILLALLYVSCQTLRKKTITANPIDQIVIPKIITDTSWTGYTIRLSDKKARYYIPLHIGNHEKKVKLDHQFLYKKGLDKYFKTPAGPLKTTWENATLDILIDTSQLIPYIDYSFWNPAILDSIELTIKSYPVFIKNPNQNACLLSSESGLSMILEAKDPQQNWRPIEGPFTFFQYEDAKHVTLPPDEILITAVLVHQGDFPTELRLKFGSSYSNIIQGSVNLRQFKYLDEMPISYCIPERG